MFMRPARTLLAAAALIGALTLAGCTTPQGNVTPTRSTSTPTPTPTPTEAAPPADEAEAITSATAVLTEWFKVRGEVNAAGGTDTALLDQVATGMALVIAQDDAKRIANGPILNVDGANIEGPSTTEGQLTFEPIASYGQVWNEIENGLVTINACQDATGYKVTTNDGTPAMTPAEQRQTFDYQITYDAERKVWLVYNSIVIGEPC